MGRVDLLCNGQGIVWTYWGSFHFVKAVDVTIKILDYLFEVSRIRKFQRGNLLGTLKRSLVRKIRFLSGFRVLLFRNFKGWPRGMGRSFRGEMVISNWWDGWLCFVGEGGSALFFLRKEALNQDNIFP